MEMWPTTQISTRMHSSTFAVVTVIYEQNESRIIWRPLKLIIAQHQQAVKGALEASGR